MNNARVDKLVKLPDLDSGDCVGSNPSSGTIYGPYVRSSDGRKIVDVIINGKKTTKLYARFLYEQHHDVEIPKHLTIDHIDGDPLNDAIENLQVMGRLENSKKYHAEHPPEMVEVICPTCNNSVQKLARQVRHNQGRQNKAGPFCSRQCAGRFNASR